MNFRAQRPEDKTKEWQDGPECQQCKSQFSVFRGVRKHHCRYCGGIFCGSCSSQSKVLPSWGSEPVRVCDTCFALPQAKPPQNTDKVESKLSESPPPLASSMTRSVFESFIGDEPVARFFPNPSSSYGTSPVLSATPPDLYLDPDMEVKTAIEIEEDAREREIKELEEKRLRKEEKRREKEKKRLIAEEKEKERLRKQQEELLVSTTFEPSVKDASPSENGEDGGLLANSIVMTDSGQSPPIGEPMMGFDETKSVEENKSEDSKQPTEQQQSPPAPVEQTPLPKEGEDKNGGGERDRHPSRRTDRPTRQRPTRRVDNGMSKKAVELVTAFYSGLRDSLRLKYALITLSRSSTAFYRARDVFILNVLLLGSYMLYFNVMEPHIESMLHWKENHYATIAVIVSIVKFLLSTIFWALWFLPLFALTFVLNPHWYDGIAYGSFGLHVFWKKGVKVNVDSRGIHTVIAEALYRNLIFGAFLGLGQVCYFIPYVGAPLYFLNLCWIYSVYCYEYKWNNQSWGLTRKLEYFETRWIYFAGFGTPIATISYFLNYFTGYALISLLFPVFIPIAMYGSPSRQKAWRPIPLSRFVDNSILTPVILFLKNRFRPAQ